MHIPDDPLYYEKFYFTPGDLGFQARSTHPSAASARSSAGISGIRKPPASPRLQGANLLFYPTAIGWHPAEKEEFGAAQYDAWQTIQRSHAIANGVYVARSTASATRMETSAATALAGPGLEFWGGSFIADPFGRILAKAPHDSEDILIEEVDLKPRRYSGATGPSCVTAASTPTRRSLSAFWIRRLARRWQ